MIGSLVDVIGSLVDRTGLMRRAAMGVARGDDWFAWGRRLSLTCYLMQLEGVTSGQDWTDVLAA